MVRVHRSLSPTSTGRPGRRPQPGRAVWAVVPAVVLAVVLAVLGLAPVGGAGAAPTVTPTLSLSTPVVTLSLPGTISGTASITSPANMTGTLEVSLYPPTASPPTGHQCQNAPVETASKKFNGSQSGTVTLSRSLALTAPEGVWGIRAHYSGDADNLAQNSPCRSTLVLAPDTSWTPEQPSSEAWLPFRSPQALVDRQYRDFFGRPPTADEQALWVSLLLGAQATPGDLVEALRRSDDNVTVVDPVTRLYQAYFLRTPDAAGLDHWVAERRSGRSLIAISEHFAASAEFTNRYGSLSNASFVDLVYRNVLGRGADQGGAAFWRQQLDGGVRTRGSLMTGFSESPEYREAVRHRVDVAVLFAFMLERAPVPAELESFVAMLALGPEASLPFTVATMAEELLDHGDYADRL